MSPNILLCIPSGKNSHRQLAIPGVSNYHSPPKPRFFRFWSKYKKSLLITCCANFHLCPKQDDLESSSARRAFYFEQPHHTALMDLSICRLYPLPMVPDPTWHQKPSLSPMTKAADVHVRTLGGSSSELTCELVGDTNTRN